MIERSQHGVKKGTAFNTQWISDLTDIFGSSAVSTSGDTTTVTLTDVQGETLEIRSTYNNNVTSVKLYYGTSNTDITDNNTDDWFAYRLVKFDNGAVAFSPFQSKANASELDAHENAKRLIWFIADCDDVINGGTKTAVFRAEATVYVSEPDEQYSYRAYIGDSDSAVTCYYNGTVAYVINAPVTVLVPAFVRSLPYITEQVYIKMQSQSQYGEIILNGSRYLSCATFCVPLEV